MVDDDLDPRLEGKAEQLRLHGVLHQYLPPSGGTLWRIVQATQGGPARFVVLDTLIDPSDAGTRYGYTLLGIRWTWSGVLAYEAQVTINDRRLVDLDSDFVGPDAAGVSSYVRLRQDLGWGPLRLKVTIAPNENGTGTIWLLGERYRRSYREPGAYPLGDP